MKPIDLLELSGTRRTPFIQQSEASECGLACLAMVASAHGLKIDLSGLRRRFGMSLRGATLKQLMNIAEEIGFNARALRGEIGDLDHLLLPAILHWDLNHYVVLNRITRKLNGKRYHILDPGRRASVLTSEAMSLHFTGVMLDLSKAESFRPNVEKSNLRITQLWSKMSGLWSSLRQVIMLSVIIQLIALAMPFYLQISIDTVFPSFDSDLLLMLALGFGGLVIINLATSWLRSLVLVSLGSSLSYQVIVNLYRHLTRLPLDWFEKRHVGDVISRFGSTRPITQLLSQGLIAAVIDGVMAFVTLALMFVYSPLLAAASLVALLLYAALRLAFLKALKIRNVDVISTAARENSSFIETVRGVGAIKAFGQEGNRQRLWQQQKADAVNAEIRLGRLNAGFDAMGQFIIGLERVLFVFLAVGMALEGVFTVGMIFAFQAYKQQFLDASMRLVEQAINFRVLDVHLKRIADIALAQPEESPEHSRAESRAEAQGALELRNVHFAYGTGEPPVIRGVNLKIDPGETVALVGPSGGGKTTLMKLMLGLYCPGHGEIRVDDVPLQSFGVGHWRRQVGYVAQDDALYAGSLAENIGFFDPEIDMGQVEAAARLACIHNEITALPLGYETLIGDMGSVLSGGQKQRVLLARALYGGPRVLFMDEGTANLDPELEAAVSQALKQLGVTMILVAHRHGALRLADRVVIVQGGIAKEVPNKNKATM